MIKIKSNMSNKSWKLIYSSDSSSSDEPIHQISPKSKKDNGKKLNSSSTKKNKPLHASKSKNLKSQSLPGTSYVESSACRGEPHTIEGLWKNPENIDFETKNVKIKQNIAKSERKIKKSIKNSNMEEEILKIKKKKKSKDKNRLSSSPAEHTAEINVKRQLFKGDIPNKHKERLISNKDDVKIKNKDTKMSTNEIKSQQFESFNIREIADKSKAEKLRLKRKRRKMLRKLRKSQEHLNLSSTSTATTSKSPEHSVILLSEEEIFSPIKNL